MTNEPDSLDIIKGSGNVYADFDVEDADLRQLKAKLAAEISKALDAEKLTVRKAAARTGFAGIGPLGPQREGHRLMKPENSFATGPDRLFVHYSAFL